MRPALTAAPPLMQVLLPGLHADGAPMGGGAMGGGAMGVQGHLGVARAIHDDPSGMAAGGLAAGGLAAGGAPFPPDSISAQQPLVVIPAATAPPTPTHSLAPPFSTSAGSVFSMGVSMEMGGDGMCGGAVGLNGVSGHKGGGACGVCGNGGALGSNGGGLGGNGGSLGGNGGGGLHHCPAEAQGLNVPSLVPAHTAGLGVASPGDALSSVVDATDNASPFSALGDSSASLWAQLSQ